MELKDARERAGLKQREVAERVGIGLRTYIRYEQEKREPRIKHALALASVLGVPVEALIHKTNGSDEDATSVIPPASTGPANRS